MSRFIELVEVEIGKIYPNPLQPRKEFPEEDLKELAASINGVGLVQPITVRKVGERYQPIAGERRLRGYKKRGLKVIPP